MSVIILFFVIIPVAIVSLLWVLPAGIAFSLRHGARIHRVMALVFAVMLSLGICFWMIAELPRWLLVMMIAPFVFIVVTILGVLLLYWSFRLAAGVRSRFQSLPAPDSLPACPPVSRLEDLLAFRLPPEEQARLNRHLDRCTACRHRLEGLEAGKEPWSELATQLRQIIQWGSRFVLGLSGLPKPDSPAACPPISRLKELLAERLSPEEQARLNRHLEGCPTCQQRLESVVAGKESLSGLAKRLSQPPQREPALKQVMDSLKREQDPEPTRDEPVVNADLPLGFLSPADKPDQLGRLGPYEVLAEIGRGGMGIVLKAFDPTLQRVVAIKVLAPQLATSGVARKRFMREAQAVAAVAHDHIVTIHAVEEANGLPYLVMQYVPGQSLQDRIDKEGPLPLKEILRIGMQTAAGLAAAHAQGIVHRDIKPANILLENGVQRVKLTDFGLARAVDDASLTQSGFVAGSPQFMAPEQARGEALDHRADLFSLGSVLYTLCTGRPPFRAANTFAVLRRVSEETPRPIREVNPEIPDWLVAVVDKLHAKDPAQRYQSAGEVAEVLGRHLAELQQAAYVPPPLPAPKPMTASQPDGLLTSLTICPICGAQLHVPEKMVGETVHCPECGKPFRVEEGSEEIHIARAVQPAPVLPPRARKRLPVWVQLLIGFMVLSSFGLGVAAVAVYFSQGQSLKRAQQQAQIQYPLAADARTAVAYMLDCLTEGNDTNLFLDNAIRPTKIEPFQSWSIQAQEVDTRNPRAAIFHGTLTTSTGKKAFTIRLWKRQNGHWGIASFAIAEPASP